MRLYCLIAVLALAACGPKSGADALVGTWDGPEGAYLKILDTGDNYAVIVKTPKEEITYEGTATPDGHIAFSRGSINETVRKATGTETGMKEFAKETDCVVIKTGEGYCR